MGGGSFARLPPTQVDWSPLTMDTERAMCKGCLLRFRRTSTTCSNGINDTVDTGGYGKLSFLDSDGGYAVSVLEPLGIAGMFGEMRTVRFRRTDEESPAPEHQVANT